MKPDFPRIILLLILVSVLPLAADDKPLPLSDIDPTVLHEQATRALNTYCVSCHGPEKQKGDLRLDSLETIDAVDRQELFRKAQEVIRLAEMPPKKAKQPKEADRKILLQWLNNQLTGKASKALAEKLRRFEYGNVVSHEDLFSGKYADLPGYTLDRRWLISEFIFNEKINRLLNLFRISCFSRLIRPYINFIRVIKFKSMIRVSKIFWDVYYHRSRSSSCSYMECFFYYFRYIFSFLNQKTMFDDRS